MKPLSRLYSLALLGYPPSFRRRHGASMLELLEAQLSDCTDRREVVAVVASACLDLAVSIPREWRFSLLPARSGGGLKEPWRMRDEEGGRNGLRLPRWRNLLRPLLRRPGASVAVVLTLTLGIGANVALYSVLRGVVLSPLPLEQAERLVRVWPGQTLCKELLDRYREESSSFEGLAAYSGWLLTLTGDGSATELDALAVSANYFSVLQVPVALGRSFTAEDARPGAEPAVIVSESLWRQRFGADPELVGSWIELGETGETKDGRMVMDRRRVVGVLPGGYQGLRRGTELWFPFVVDATDDRDYGGSWYLQTVGRLLPDVDVVAAGVELQTLARHWQEGDYSHFEDETIAGARVEALREWMVGEVRLPLLLLLGAVFLVLCIACVNVANLLLAGTLRRRQEMVVRSALGASNARLMRVLLSESVVLSLVGAGLGVLVAWWLQRGLAVWLPTVLPRSENIAIDLPVLGFAVACALFAALVATAPSAWIVARGDAAGLRARNRPGGERLRHSLVLAEVATSLVLLLCAGLLVKSFWSLLTVDPGFDADEVTVLRLSTSPKYGESERWAQLGEQLIDGLQTVPGVERAGAIHLLPLTKNNWSFPYQAEDHPVAPGSPPPVANYRVVAGDYFQTLRVPLLAGRLPSTADRAGAPPVVVLNRTMAAALWGVESAVGKRLDLFLDQPHQVIGVVGDVRQHRLDLEVQPEMYFPLAQQRSTGLLHLLVRSKEPSERLVPALRQAIEAVDPLIPIGEVVSMREAVGRSVGQMRFTALLVSVFGLVAVGLSMLGIYGVLATLVQGRWRELGIRLALGARRGEVERDGMRPGLVWIAAGAALGLMGGLWASRALERFLFAVDPYDPWVYLAATTLLLAAALLASWLPARRAARLDPSTVLRSE